MPDKETSRPKVKSGSSVNKTGLFYIGLFMLNPLAAAMGAQVEPTVKKQYAESIPYNDACNDLGIGQEKDFVADDHQAFDKRICAAQVIAVGNKADKVTLGSKDGEFLPLSCLTDSSSTECVAERNAYRMPTRAISERYNKVYTGHVNAIQNWYSKNRGTMKSLISSMDHQQKDDFKRMMGVIETLMKTYYAQDYALKPEGRIGNCEEHNAITLHKLLQEKMLTGSKIKIQYVYVSSSTAKEGIKDHVYLLLDSNISDKFIQRNRNFVEAFHKSIKKGKICDTWNNGFYDDFDKTENKDFYQRGAGAGWDTLEIKTIDMDFKGFENLTSGAKEFICEALQKMNLLPQTLAAQCNLKR